MFNRQSGFNKNLSGLGAGAEKKNEMENENLSQADILYAKSKREYMKSKIKKQFKDFNYKMEDINGYVFKKNSAPVRRIKNSDSFEGFLKNNQEKTEKGEDFTGRFLSREKGLFGAYGSVDFFNNGFDEEGNLHLFMFDTYDFNKGENALVEAGRREMMDGYLKGFFTLHEITLSKKEYEKILNK